MQSRDIISGALSIQMSVTIEERSEGMLLFKNMLIKKYILYAYAIMYVCTYVYFLAGSSSVGEAGCGGCDRFLLG